MYFSDNQLIALASYSPICVLEHVESRVGDDACLSIVWKLRIDEILVQFDSPSRLVRQREVAINHFWVIGPSIFHVRIGEVVEMFKYFDIPQRQTEMQRGPLSK